MSEAAQAAIGHNNGPVLPSVESVEAYLLAEYDPVLRRADELMENAPRFLNVDSDQADADATEFAVKLRAGWKSAEAGRQKEKAPFDDVAGFIHAFFKVRVLDRIEAVSRELNEAQTAWKLGVMRAEQETRAAELRRKLAEEAETAAAAAKARAAADELARSAARARKPENVERLSQEAAAATEQAHVAAQTAEQVSQERSTAQKEAHAPAADLTRNRGARGGVSSLASFPDFRDLDTEELAKGGILALLPYIKQPALESAVRDYIKGNRAAVDRHLNDGTQPIRGVTLFKNYKNRGRA